VGMCLASDSDGSPYPEVTGSWLASLATVLTLSMVAAVLIVELSWPGKHTFIDGQHGGSAGTGAGLAGAGCRTAGRRCSAKWRLLVVTLRVVGPGLHELFARRYGGGDRLALAHAIPGRVAS